MLGSKYIDIDWKIFRYTQGVTGCVATITKSTLNINNDTLCLPSVLLTFEFADNILFKSIIIFTT